MTEAKAKPESGLSENCLWPNITKAYSEPKVTNNRQDPDISKVKINQGLMLLRPTQDLKENRQVGLVLPSMRQCQEEQKSTTLKSK